MGTNENFPMICMKYLVFKTINPFSRNMSILKNSDSETQNIVGSCRKNPNFSDRQVWSNSVD